MGASLLALAKSIIHLDRIGSQRPAIRIKLLFEKGGCFRKSRAISEPSVTNRQIANTQVLASDWLASTNPEVILTIKQSTHSCQISTIQPQC